jgi:hypothetical protein
MQEVRSYLRGTITKDNLAATGEEFTLTKNSMQVYDYLILQK